MKKAVKAKVVGMKIQTLIYSRKLPESIENAISFDVIYKSKISKVSWKFYISRDSSLPSVPQSPAIGHFSNDLKGVVMKNFPRGKPLDHGFCLLCLHLVSAPPI